MIGGKSDRLLCSPDASTYRESCMRVPGIIKVRSCVKGCVVQRRVFFLVFAMKDFSIGKKFQLQIKTHAVRAQTKRIYL